MQCLGVFGNVVVLQEVFYNTTTQISLIVCLSFMGSLLQIGLGDPCFTHALKHTNDWYIPHYLSSWNSCLSCSHVLLGE